MKFKWDEPMNPYAAQDFASAIKRASENMGAFSKDFREQVDALHKTAVQHGLTEMRKAGKKVREINKK